MTKYQLMLLLFSKEQPIVKINGRTGILSSITREDGSGHNFCVKLYTLDNTFGIHGEFTEFIRTID